MALWTRNSPSQYDKLAQCWIKVGPVRLRRWPNIKEALGQCMVSEEWSVGT